MKTIQQKFWFKRKEYAVMSVVLLLLAYFLIPSKTFAFDLLPADIKPAFAVLKDDASIKEIWTTIIDLLNGLVVVLLIFVGIAQILRLNLNTYGVKKILPALLLAIIAANFSYLVCRLMVDLANVAIAALISNANGAHQSATALSGALNGSQGPGWSSPYAAHGQFADMKNNVANIFWFIIVQFVQIATAIVLYILAFLFFIRLWLIYFMVPIAPLAFVAMVLPQTKSLFNQWFSTFSKWVFMPVVSVFWLWLGSKWLSVLGDGWFMQIVFGVVCLVLAVTTPFKMGGAIMQKWGDLGKKVTSPAINAARQQASLAWSKQAASGNKWNPLGHIARGQLALKDMQKFTDERIKNNMDTGLAKSFGFEKREALRGKFGGDLEMAKARGVRKYLETDEGKKWAEGRAEFFADLGNEKAKGEAGLAKGESKFRLSTKGNKIAEETLLAQKKKELENFNVQEADKILAVSFNREDGKGIFKDDEQLAKNYFAAMTRNKTLDEAVSQSQNVRIEGILSDQLFIENIKRTLKDIGGIPDKLTRLNSQDERMQELRDQRLTRGTTDEETAELRHLEATETERNNQRKELVKLRESEGQLRDKAFQFVQDKHDAGEYHLDGFVHLDERSGQKIVDGFAGSISVGNGTFKEGVGQALMTRAGKLMSIEIKADADKLIDRATIEEIAEELRHGKAVTPFLKFDAQDVERFRNGQQFQNTPQANREIEAHMIALSKVARQNNHPEAPSARSALVSMLNDDAAKSAAGFYNRLAEERGISEFIENVGSLSAVQIRTELIKKMSARGQISSTAFAAVTNQRNVGLSDNPASYLSTSGHDRSVIIQNSTVQSVPTQKFNSMVSSVVLSRGDYNPSLAKNPEITKALGEVTDLLKFERNHLANEIGKQVGLNMASEKVRLSLGQAISKIPINIKDPKVVAQALNPIISQLGGKALDPSASISVKKSDGTTKEVTLDGAVRRSNIAQQGIESAGLLSVKPRVDEISGQLKHFAGRDSSEAQFIFQYLDKMLDGEGGIRTPATGTEEIQKKVNEALKQLGFIGSTPISFESNDKAIDFLKRTRDAASIASKAEAYGENGQFDPHRAEGLAAKMYFERERA